METNNDKTTATFTHLSALTQYFFPFGNYIFPMIIWASKKDKSEYVDFHGKQVLNFQLSQLLYTLVLGAIAVPIFLFTVFNNIPMNAIISGDDFTMDHLSYGKITGIVVVGIIAVMLFIGMKMLEFFLIIYASIKASNGEKYKYPLTINFIK